MTHSWAKVGVFIALIPLIIVQCYTAVPKKPPHPNSAFRHYENALICQFDAKWDSALVQISRAIKMNNKIALFYVLKAQVFDSLNQIDSAIAAYQQALKVRPYAPDVMEALGELYIRHGNHEQGIAYLKRAFAHDETQTRLLLRIAELYMRLGRKEEAKDVLTDYKVRMDLAHLSADPKYFLLMGEIAYQEKRWQDAAHYYEVCPCKRCFTPQEAIQAFKVLFKFGKLDSYYRLLTGVEQRKFKQGILFYYRGLYYREIGNLNEAEHQFQLALQHGSQMPEVLYEMAQIYHKRGQKQKIEPLIRRLERIAPHSPYLAKMRALLQ
jgi:tetratricopeptide (TPR) repeat protein